MKATTHRYHLIIMATLVSWGCFFMTSCENDPKRIDALTRNVVMKEEAIKVEAWLSQNGLMKAKLTSPLMLRVAADTPYVEFPKTLHVDFYDSTSVINSWLDARYAKYFEALGKVYLRDSVVVITNKGDTLRSPDLWWDQNTKMFYTDKFAIYHGVGKAITGSKGLEATQDLNSVIFHDPTGTVEVSSSGFPAN